MFYFETFEIMDDKIVKKKFFKSHILKYQKRIQVFYCNYMI